MITFNYWIYKYLRLFIAAYSILSNAKSNISADFVLLNEASKSI